MISFFQKAKQGGKHGTHAGSSGKSRFHTFQHTHPVGKFLHGGIGKTTVNIVVIFICKSSTHFFRTVESKAACKKDRRRMFFFVCLLYAGTYHFRYGVYWHKNFIT